MESPLGAATSTQRSTFVAVVAWIFIVLSAVSIPISIFQTLMVFWVFPAHGMSDIWSGPGAQGVPTFARLMFQNARVFVVGIFAVSVTTLISAIGLLKRKNWARILFIVLMALGILWSLGSLFLQWAFMQELPAIPRRPGVPDVHNTMFLIMQVFTALWSLGLSVLFGWIITKLLSEQIRREFPS